MKRDRIMAIFKIKTMFKINKSKLIFLFILLAGLFVINPVFSHKRALYNVVIDTDCGVDDFRALTYFLASRDFNINAITSVDGVFTPNKSANYIHQLLNKYEHQGIMIGEGEEYNASKQYKTHAKAQWDNIFPENTKTEFPSAIEVLRSAINYSSNSTIIIAMGPLSNIAELLKTYPEVFFKVEVILWYCNYDNAPAGYNYEQDTDAYNLIREYNIPVKMISDGGHKYSEDFSDNCKQIKNSIYAETLVKFMQNFDNKYYWDDMLPLYLLYPNVFEEKRVSGYSAVITPKKEAFFDILVTSILNYNKPDEGVVFNEVPTSGYMLRSDLHEYLPAILDAHGYHEFKIVALASEIHSHLGLYAIMGAKMGLRIMEYLHVGLDEVSIISYAGSNPPVSCFNDGIQVGTGATIGYGKIDVKPTETPIPAVEVLYNNRKIHFSLKDEILTNIRKEIGNLVQKYGLENEMYWLELRKIAIKYWLEVCRFEAFEIKEIIAEIKQE